jgi:hypothetical protein
MPPFPQHTSEVTNVGNLKEMSVKHQMADKIVKNSWAEGWEKIRIREELGIWLLFPWE